MQAVKGLLALAPEGTYGTYTDVAQVAIPVETVSAKLDANLQERNDMIGSIDKLSSLPTRKVIEIPFTGKVYPDNVLGYLLWCLLGDATTAGAGADKTHTFNLTETGLTQQSLSAEYKEADQVADDYAGCFLKEITISGSNDGYIKITGTLSAKKRAAGTVMTPIVITTLDSLKYCQAAVTFGGAAVKYDSWSITINPNLLTENFKDSCDTEKPVPNGKPIITASLEFDTVDRANRALYEAGTQEKKLLVVITSAETIAATGTPYSVSFELPDTQITNIDYTGDDGQKKESLELTAYVGTAVSTNETYLEAILVNAATAYA